MQIFVEKDYNAVSEKASEIILNCIRENPRIVLGLATGSTPEKTYKLIAQNYKKNKLSFKEVKTFNLDEYLGLENSHKQSYHSFMKKNLFNKIDINIKNTFFPTEFISPGKYEQQIKDNGGIDLQILGIGRNGHIGFNEPYSSFKSKTRKVSLTKTTIKDNSRFFTNRKEVPVMAVTMGINTIMQAKKIILLASGKNKQKAVLNLITNKISNKNPASILWTHKNVIFLIDKACIKK
jgi:glucosamine-6-phosphate deaminase